MAGPIHTRPHLAFVAALMVALLGACSDDATSPEKQQGNPDAESVNEFFAALPSWPDQPKDALQEGASRQQIVRNPGDDLDYRCEATKKTQIKSFDRIAAAGMDEDVIWPGAVLQGGTLESGRPERLNLPRRSITLRIDVPVAEQSRVVEMPNSVNTGQAVADLIRDVASAQGELDPVRSEIDFTVSEASSFEQSMLSMGVGGGFKEPYSGIAVEGNIEGGIDRSMTTHSAVVMLQQEMFTISFADDLPSADTPSEMFADTLKPSDLQALMDEGDIGHDNIPVYVKSVTYGRLLIASVKSTSVSSGAKLSAALGASYEEFGAGGNMSAEQREILENSSWQYSIFGGSQDAADNAIGSLDWSEYFTPTLATTAVPLRFELRTVAEQLPAGFHDTVEYEVRGECTPPRAYEITATLKRVELAAGNCFVPCEYDAQLRADTGLLIDSVWHLRVGTVSNANPIKTPNSSRVVDFDTDDVVWATGFLNATHRGDSPEWTYPFAALENEVPKNVIVKANAPLAAQRLDFTFQFKKRALY